MAGVLRRAATYRLEHRDALRVDVTAGGDAHPALDHRPQVRDDVPEHVLHHDHVEPLLFLYETHSARPQVSWTWVRTFVLPTRWSGRLRSRLRVSSKA